MYLVQFNIGVWCNGSMSVSKTVGEGSSPSTPAIIYYLDVAQFVRVLEWGSRGRELESLHSDHGM